MKKVFLNKQHFWIDTTALIICLSSYYLYSIFDTNFYSSVFLFLAYSIVIYRLFLMRKTNIINKIKWLVKDTIIIVSISLLFALYIMVANIFTLTPNSTFIYTIVFIWLILIIYIYDLLIGD